MSEIQLPQSVTHKIFVPNSYSANKTVESINSYIDNNYSEYVSIDISFLNVIDSAYVSTMCSTKHFIKYPQGKICWTVSSDLVKDFNKDFELGNTEYIVL